MVNIREMIGTLMAALEKEAAAVEERAVEVEKKREELEEEKRLMSSLRHGTTAAEVVEVNVGGKIFQTKRATLLSAEGSLLAAMFSGRWEESLDRDKDGRVFFDFDPAHFQILLNRLRLRCIAEPKKVLLPIEQPQHKDLFDAMVEFLGVQEVLYGQSLCDSAAFECTQVGSRDGSIQIEGQRISGGTGDHCAAVGKAQLASTARTASAAWKVSFARLRPEGWVYAGIIGNPSPGDQSYYDPTSFGWSSTGQIFTAGQYSYGGTALQQGDCAVFQLDAAGSRLRMSVERTGRVYDIPLPEGSTAQARLHLNLYTPGTEVVVSAATADEVSRAGL